MGGCLNDPKAAEKKAAKQGKTPEQCKVIDYFYGGGGCLSSTMSDSEYESLVQARANSEDFKARALNKLGIDETEVNEIEPVHFEGYNFDNKSARAIQGKDLVWRSSQYQITWLFFSSTQIYVYQYTFNMDSNTVKEKTDEYFYRDVTNFSSKSDSVEKIVPKSGGCLQVSYINQNVDTSTFMIVVPGMNFTCSMSQNEYTDRAIQGMKSKLREKKNS